MKNQLTFLDVSNCIGLKVLDAERNDLIYLRVWQRDVTAVEDPEIVTSTLNKNISLTYLDCSGNQITSLDISNNDALEA